MRICKSCGEKFTFKQNIKSLYKRKGDISCERCKSVFVLKKQNALLWVLDCMYLYLLITISDEIGGIKGIILSMIIASVGVFISLNLDSRYKLKEPS